MVYVDMIRLLIEEELFAGVLLVFPERYLICFKNAE